jgi:hypothetical protein
MTWEELITKAEEHAKAAGLPVERLYKPKVRETAVVTFISKNSKAKAKFHLDAITGGLNNRAISPTPGRFGPLFGRALRSVRRRS